MLANAWHAMMTQLFDARLVRWCSVVIGRTYLVVPQAITQVNCLIHALSLPQVRLGSLDEARTGFQKALRIYDAAGEELCASC